MSLDELSFCYAGTIGHCLIEISAPLVQPGTSSTSCFVRPDIGATGALSSRLCRSRIAMVEARDRPIWRVAPS